MKIHIAAYDQEAAQGIIGAVEMNHNCCILEDMDAVTDLQSGDLLAIVDPPRIPAEPLADNQLILDFDLGILEIDKKEPRLYHVPVAAQVDKHDLVIRVCDGFDVPLGKCQFCFYSLTLIDDITATAVHTCEIESNRLEMLLQYKEMDIAGDWNYIKLEEEEINEIVSNAGRQIVFTGTYLKAKRQLEEYDFSYVGEETVYALISRIVDNFEAINSQTLRYNLLPVEETKEAMVYDFPSDIAVIEKQEMKERILVRGGCSLVNIIPRVTPKFSKQLLYEMQNPFESCVIKTHPFHAVHCKLWVEEISDEIKRFLTNDMQEGVSTLFAFDKASFWSQFYQEYFVKQIISAARLDIWVNEKRPPVVVPEDQFLAAFPSVKIDRSEQIALYHFRCRAFGIPEESPAFHFPPPIEAFEQDFIRQKYRGVSFYYGLFETVYTPIPRPRETEWSLRCVSCSTVDELLKRIYSDGVEASALFTTKGRILYPGNGDFQLDVGLEIVVDIEDGEEVPNYIIV